MSAIFSIFGSLSSPVWLRQPLAWVVWVGLITCPASAAPPAAAMEVTQIEGHDYISAESIKRFFDFPKMSRFDNTLVLESPKVVMKLRVGGNECTMNNVKFIFSQSIATVGEKVYVSRMDFAKLIEPVLRPNFIQNAGDFRTVILDPGHGGKDPGATNPIGTEAGYNVKVAGIVKKQLELKGFKVVMTRDSNIFKSLQERVDFANAVQENAVCVSIHFNSGNRSARGVETFTLSPPGISHYGSEFKPSDNQTRIGNEHDSANIALATSVHGSVLRRLGKNTLDRGIKRARFNMLSGVRHPAILLEGGFLTHPYEARLIADEAYQNAIAGGIVDAIAKYRMAVAKRPAPRP